MDPSRLVEHGVWDNKCFSCLDVVEWCSCSTHERMFLACWRKKSNAGAVCTGYISRLAYDDQDKIR